MYDHLVVKQPTFLSFMTVMNPADAVCMLVENESTRLTSYLDCLEILRYGTAAICVHVSDLFLPSGRGCLEMYVSLLMAVLIISSRF